MNFVINIIWGIIIGAAMIIPGVSGGVLAVVIGIYDKLIKALNNIFKDFKTNFLWIYSNIRGNYKQHYKLYLLLFSRLYINHKNPCSQKV
jgi:uncharacterized membrane protein